MPYADDGHDVPKYVTGGAKRRRQWSHVWNSAYHRAKKQGKSDKEAEEFAFREANGVAGPNKTSYDVLTKRISDAEATEIADKILKAMEQEWNSLPSEVQEQLVNASLSGVGQGMLQIEYAPSGIIAAANEIAHDYAVKRAAEMVGMKYNKSGDLVKNPDARWAISDTTREKIHDIVAESFQKELRMEEIKAHIQKALHDQTKQGIFSEARAEMIARTEVINAQTHGNFDMWKKSGIVKTVRWLTAEDERTCPECEQNSDAVVELGKPFPSGAIMPTEHPNCRCALTVEDVSD